MADYRCPLCMEKLKNGECLSCGYRLPNEENLSELYDAEPSEYYEPEPIREITPEIQMEEIYPNREETAIPNFKVRDDEGKTVRNRIDLASIDNRNRGNPNATGGNPYAGYTPEGVPNSGGSPFANPSANQSSGTDTASDFWTKYWWLMLLSFFIPILGVILYASMKNELKQYKASYLVIVAIVLGFIIPP